jgi:RNA polymerase sigma-70 factor (ECF subfamily)
MRVGAESHAIEGRGDSPVETGDAAAASPIDLVDVYQSERPRLLRLLRRRTGLEDAQDIVQQVFVRLLAGAFRKASPVRSPQTYLYQSAINQVRDRGRSDQRRSTALHVTEDQMDTLAAPSQIAALEARDMLRRIEAAIGSLKPKTREIFLAHRIDGYTYAEIAARTGLSVKAIEKQMSNAIAHIDRVLGPR